jgi:hypothetical protein
MNPFKTAALLCLLFSIAVSQGIGQTISSTGFLLDKMEQKLADYSRKNQTVMRAEIGIIHQDSTAKVFRSFSDEYSYEIFAFADPAQIRDVDIRVYRLVDGGWRLEFQDRSNAAEARMIFEPPAYDIYLLEVDGISFAEEVGKYGLMVSLIRD